MEQLEKFKSLGVDSISPHVLHECASSLSLLLERSELPLEWTLANVTPIYKIGCTWIEAFLSNRKQRVVL